MTRWLTACTLALGFLVGSFFPEVPEGIRGLLWVGVFVCACVALKESK